MQGAVKKLTKVTDAERLSWAHDRMMEALRRAALHRDDRALTAAALSRAAEYDEAKAAMDRKKREASERAMRSLARRKRAARETVPCEA